MADSKKQEAAVPEGQVKATAEQSNKEVKESLAFTPDKELHPSGDPEHAADQTSVPGPEYPPLDRPPVATPRHDEPIIRTLATGAGAHMPPDPAQFDEMGRVRDEE